MNQLLLWIIFISLSRLPPPKYRPVFYLYHSKPPPLIAVSFDWNRLKAYYSFIYPEHELPVGIIISMETRLRKVAVNPKRNLYGTFHVTFALLT